MPVLVAERGDAALGGNARAGEDDDVSCTTASMETSRAAARVRYMVPIADSGGIIEAERDAYVA